MDTDTESDSFLGIKMIKFFLLHIALQKCITFEGEAKMKIFHSDTTTTASFEKLGKF